MAEGAEAAHSPVPGPGPDGIESAGAETLLVIRDNLLTGLDRVATALEAGTFNVVGGKGKAPPRESGTLTLILLAAVDARLRELGYETIFKEAR